MKENQVEVLATLLKTTSEKVKESLENDTLGEVVKSFTDVHTIFDEGEKAKFRQNLIEEIKPDVISEIASGTEFPKPIYDKVKGNVLEKTEKNLAKQHGVDKWDGLEGLVETIVESKAKNPDLQKYKDRIDELEKAHEVEVQRLGKAVNDKIINMEVSRFVDGIEINAEGERLENQKNILRTMIAANFDFGVDGDRVVIEKSPIPHKKSNLDPLPNDEVLLEFAKSYVDVKSSDGGGRGSSSSTSSSKIVNFPEYCKKEGIQPNSKEHIKALREFTEKGYTIEY